MRALEKLGAGEAMLDRAGLGYAVMRRFPVRWTVPRRFGGSGSILMLHRVQAGGAGGLPGGVNATNSVEPAFLRGAIALLRRRGYDLVHMSEAVRRLGNGDRRRFACLTFDDGYRDTHEVVHPICSELGVPYTLYVTTGQLDGSAVTWWIGLEELLASHRRLEYEWRGQPRALDTSDLPGKLRANNIVSRQLREALPTEAAELVAQLSERYDVDCSGLSRAAALTRGMLEAMAREDLVEVGAHTVHHASIRQLPEPLARAELVDSRRTLERLLHRPVTHFAYPYGTARHVGMGEPALVEEAGYDSAVTTRHANVVPGHRDHLRLLPRLPVDGRRQSLRYLDAVLSGAVAAISHPRKQLMTI